MTNNNPWIPWHGGVNPVPGKLVDIRYVKGQEHYFAPSAMFEWGGTGSWNDIIAYRLAEAVQAPVEYTISGETGDANNPPRVYNVVEARDWEAVRIQAAIAFMAALLPLYPDGSMVPDKDGSFLPGKATLAVKATDALIAALKGGEK